MFTPRERAHTVYTHARAVGNGPVLGGDMEWISRRRLVDCDQAVAIITAAFSSERRLLSEPSDEQLTQMLSHVERLRTAIAARLNPVDLTGTKP